MWSPAEWGEKLLILDATSQPVIAIADLVTSAPSTNHFCKLFTPHNLFWPTVYSRRVCKKYYV